MLIMPCFPYSRAWEWGYQDLTRVYISLACEVYAVLYMYLNFHDFFHPPAHPSKALTEKNEGCFSQLWLCQLQCTWDNIILETLRKLVEAMKMVLCQLIPLTQLLQECATWKLPNYCTWEAIKKTFKEHIERLLGGHLSGIFTCPLKLLKCF